MATKHYVGFDLGGTNMKAAVVDTDTGELSGVTSLPTQSRDGSAAVLARMAELVRTVAKSAGVELRRLGGVGVGLPAFCDMQDGSVVFMTNFPGQWRGVQVRDPLATLLDIPVFILNDARAMTYGEYVFGAGRGVDTVACYTIGTGIGGGLVINGRLHLAMGGTAGELGHMIIDKAGPQCGCGSRGCVEAFASGPAIAAMGMKAVAQGRATAIADLCDGDLNRITPALIAQAAQAGDGIAADIFEQAGYSIGCGVASMLVAIAPQRVIIGGGVAQAGDLLLEPIRRTIRSQVHVIPVDQVEVVAAQLGTNAGIVGAAAWARQARESSAAAGTIRRAGRA